MGKTGKRVLVGALALLLATTGLVPGGTRQAQALTIADRIETIETWRAPWAPTAPGPSGIAYREGTNTLIVVDGDKNNEPGAPPPLPNLWEYDLDTKTVVYSAFINVMGDATGVSWDEDGNRLFVSSDSAEGVFVFTPGGNGRFGGNSTAFIDVALLVPPPIPPALGPDVEDPAYDASNGHLFVLSGNQSLIYEIDPGVGGTFGNGDDLLVGTGFPVPLDTVDPPDEDPDDWEGLALDPDTDNLLVGAKETDLDHSIYEVTKAGVFVDRIDVTVIEDELGELPPLTISGLTVQPAAGDELTTYWIADRGDSTPPETNDGRLHRIHREAVVVPNADPLLDPIGNKSGNEGTLITFDVNATDDFGDTLSFSLQAGAPTGAAINATTGVFTWTPTEAQGRPLPHSVTVRVTDALGNFDFEQISITANEVNQAPVAVDFPSLMSAEGDSVSVQLLASDGDVPAQTKTWSVTGLPSGLSFGTTTGLISGTVAANASSGSPYGVTVTVTDSGSPAMNDQFTFSFTIEAGSGPGPGPGPGPNPGPNTFVDDDGHIFESAIEWLAAEGITSGCNPPANDRFCPDNRVTRGQMASFLVRALDYTEIGDDYFTDDNDSIFENAINRLRTAEVTLGCNPPANTRYCPDDFVTRGQMAAFLVRGLNLPAYTGPDRFRDDDGHVFEGAIERLAQAGITLGCNPPTNDRFCPNDFVSRGQMAAFLKRALES